MLCCVDVVMEMSAMARLLYQTARVVHGALGIDIQENAPATTLLVSADCGIIRYFDRLMKVLLYGATHRVGCSGQFRDLGLTPEPGPLPSLRSIRLIEEQCNGIMSRLPYNELRGNPEML